MLMKRLYNRSGFDPDAHQALRGEVARLTAALKAAKGPEAKALIAQLGAKRKELAAAAPTVVGVTVMSTGTTPEQNFTENLVAQAAREGWLERKGNVFILHRHEEHTPDPAHRERRALKPLADLSYDILRGPGYYCCHCGAEIPDAGGREEDGRTIGQHHVSEEHGAADDAVAAAMSSTPAGSKAQWQAVRAAGAKLGLDGVGQVNLANNPAGYRRIAHYECRLTKGAVK